MIDAMPAHPSHSRTVGPRIADLVDASGLKQAAIARKLGMSRAALNDRLRGRTRWAADELPPLAAVLGVSPAAFLPTEEDLAA